MVQEFLVAKLGCLGWVIFFNDGFSPVVLKLLRFWQLVFLNGIIKMDISEVNEQKESFMFYDNMKMIKNFAENVNRIAKCLGEGKIFNLHCCKVQYCLR